MRPSSTIFDLPDQPYCFKEPLNTIKLAPVTIIGMRKSNESTSFGLMILRVHIYNGMVCTLTLSRFIQNIYSLSMIGSVFLLDGLYTDQM